MSTTRHPRPPVIGPSDRITEGQDPQSPFGWLPASPPRKGPSPFDVPTSSTFVEVAS